MKILAHAALSLSLSLCISHRRHCWADWGQFVRPLRLLCRHLCHLHRALAKLISRFAVDSIQSVCSSSLLCSHRHKTLLMSSAIDFFFLFLLLVVGPLHSSQQQQIWFLWPFLVCVCVSLSLYISLYKRYIQKLSNDSVSHNFSSALLWVFFLVSVCSYPFFWQ